MENNNFCTFCGAKLEDCAKFCTFCGKAVNEFRMPTVKTASWWIMGVFFGTFIFLALICFLI